MEPRIELAKALDTQVSASSKREAFEPTMQQWSRTIREAIGLPVTSLAKRLRISQPALTQLEQSEERGTISVERLQALANAVDCTFVYGFVPNRSFQEMARDRATAIDYARRYKKRIPRG